MACVYLCPMPYHSLVFNINHCVCLMCVFVSCVVIIGTTLTMGLCAVYVRFNVYYCVCAVYIRFKVSHGFCVMYYMLVYIQLSWSRCYVLYPVSFEYTSITITFTISVVACACQCGPSRIMTHQ